MSTTTEVACWIVLLIISFFICNVFVYLRTAASLVIAFAVASILVRMIFKSIFGEIAFTFAWIITMFYGLFRALRDFRDDSGVKKPTGAQLNGVGKMTALGVR